MVTILFDLTGGVFALVKANTALYDEFSCGNWEPTEPAQTEDVTEGPCANIVTKVLVMYTDYAASKDPNIYTTAVLGINQTNLSWANSGINNHLLLAGVVEFTAGGVVVGSNYIQDIWNFKNNIGVNTSRDLYNAEIVVLLNKYYDRAGGGRIEGYAAEVGGSAADAFCIVDIEQATSERRVFAHEVTHILGGKHDDDDNDPYWARGHLFHTEHRKFLRKTYRARYTLMANLPYQQVRVDFVSNPNITFHNVATGLSDRYNALRVNQLKNHVANFKDDPALPLYANISQVVHPSECETAGSATVSVRCGKPPYTYEWFTKNYTQSSNWIPAGNTATITTYTPLTGTAYYAPLRVKVTDADNNVTWSLIKYSNGYCHYLTPHAPYTVVEPNNRPFLASTNNNSAEIVPNPNDGSFAVKFFTEESEMIAIKVFDLSGRLAMPVLHLQSNKGQNTTELNLKNKLAKGMYILSIDGAKTTYNQRLSIN